MFKHNTFILHVHCSHNAHDVVRCKVCVWEYVVYNAYKQKRS